MRKNNKGITLVALVITIIVLLILAGVSIATLVGDNGIINRTATAKQTTEEKAELEKVKLAVQAARIHGDSYSSLKAEDVIYALQKDNIAVTGDAFPLTATSGLYQFTIDANGNVSKKDTTTPSNPATVSVTGVSIEVTGGTVNQDESITIAPGETLTLEATVTPGDATDKSLTWSVSPNDESVISLSSTTSATITVTGVAVGAEARTVTVTTTDGSFEASKTIKVENGTQTSSVTLKSGTSNIEITAENASTYYGRTITNYGPTKGSYQLFYIDFANDFGDGEGTIYLKATYSDDSSQQKSLTLYDTTTTPETLIKEMNPEWAKPANRGQTTAKDWNPNEKAVAWLCQPTRSSSAGLWKDFYDDENEEKINYVIGSPSVDMFIKSYNAVSAHTTKLDYAFSTNATAGYRFKPTTDSKLDNGYGRYSSNNSVATDCNSMYCTSDKNWWLASPSAYGADGVCFVRGSDACLNGNNSARGVSPLVSLKSSFIPELGN